MGIKIYKTFEISDDLWKEITDGFNESFGTQSDVESMKQYYFENILGYAFHAVAFADDGNVMGFNTFSPIFYKRNIKTVLSGSVYVKKQYRKNAFLSVDMLNALREYCRKEGYLIELGVPNKNAEKMAKVVGRAKPIGVLDYYILPIHISKCINKPSWKIFDYILRPIVYLYGYAACLLASVFNTKEKQVKYEIDKTETFINRRLGESYHHIAFADSDFYYRKYDENGITVTYIMDFSQNGARTSLALAKAVKWLLNNEKMDAIAFVGWLRLFQAILIKVPQKFNPKRLPLVYYVLNKKDKELFQDMSDKNNWNFSLINFDVR